MNNILGPAVLRPSGQTPYVGIRKLENGFVVSVYDREYVFTTFEGVTAFLAQAFDIK